MGQFDATSYFAGGVGIVPGGGKGRKPDPTRDIVASGPGWLQPNLLTGLEREFDEISRAFGSRVYEAMLGDPAVGSSYRSLQLGIMDGGVSLGPAIKPPVGWRKPMPGKTTPIGVESSPTAPSAPSLTPDQQMSQDMLAFCQHNITRLGESLCPSLFQSLDAMKLGVKLGEFTFEVEKQGDYAGKLAWKDFAVKPNGTWRFVVDRFLKVRRILTWDGDRNQYEFLDVDTPEGRAKFSWLSWMPENGDPRGTSILRAAYTAWNLKIQTWPLYYQYLVRFGSPGLDAELAEADVVTHPDIDSEGNEIAGQTVSPAQHFMKLLRLYKGGGIIVRPFGSKLNVVEPQTAGEAFLAAFDIFDRQITRAIELQVRASMESKHGSKADSETAQDTKGLVIAYGREATGGMLRHALRGLVELNYGPEVAAMHTPTVSLGKAEQQDKASLWTAAGSLVSTGYLGESQKAELDAEIGLPVRDAEADAAAAAEKQQKALEMAQATKPPGGGGGPPPPPAKSQPAGAPKQ